MADEVDIEPEFEDEDDFIDRLSQTPLQESPDTTAPTGAPPVDQDVVVPSSTPRFTPGASNRNNQRDIDRAQREAARRRREEQAEARRLLREQQEAQDREQRAAAREAQRLSREQITNARSEAISSRVQAYSLSASLGLPGYVAASVVDSLLIRPRENSIVDEQNQYQRDLQRYLEARRREELEERRRREREIRDTPITATALDATGSPIPPGTGGIPPTPPPPPNQPGGSGSSGSSGGPPNQPPLIPPTPPTPRTPSALGQSLTATATVLTASIQGLQVINSAVDSFAKNANQLATSIAKDDATGATKSVLKTGQSLVDPLGINVPVNVAVQSFDVLLDTSKAILDTTKKNIAFAPQSLQAEVQGDIQKLIQSIELTRKNDATTAQLIRANTQFELAWTEARAKFIEVIGPILTRMLEKLTWMLELMQTLSQIGYAISIHIPVIGRYIESILNRMPKEHSELDDSDILNQIDRFFDPDRTKQNMRNRNRFPNP